MRIELILSDNEYPIPFNYNHKLISSLHRIIGMPNRWHDMKYSPYSISTVLEAKASEKGIYTTKGVSKIIITSHFEEFIYDLIEGLKCDNKLFFGVRVIRIVESDIQLHKDRFFAASPIFLPHRLEDGSVQHLTFDNPFSSHRMLESCKSKMKVYDISGDIEAIYFDTTYKKSKTTLIKANKNSKIKTHRKANICPIIIKADKEVKQFLCDVGVGALTGSGFGCLV